MKHFYLLLILLFSFSAFAQISYTSANHASGNYDLPMTTVAAGITAFSFDTTGANIIWDYSGLGMNLSGKKTTVTAASSGYQAPFITQCILGGGGFGCLTRWNSLTNMGMVDLDSLDALVFTLFDIMTMAKKNSGTLIGNVKGLKIKDTNGLTVPVVAEYAESDTILTFPFTYQDSGKSYGQWGLDLNSIGQNIQYKVTYDRKWEVEGWGKLITPYQTHNNVLKIKTTLDQVDSVIFLTTPLGLPRKIVEYTWYDATYGLPVMRADGIEALGFTTITTVQYYDRRVVGLDESIENNKVEVVIYPNPSADKVNFDYEGSIIKSFRIIDIQGKVIQNSTFKKTTDISQLKEGVYIIQFMDKKNGVVNTNKLIKK